MGLKWSDFRDVRELVMLMEELSILIHRNSGTLTFKKSIRVLEKFCGKALWPFLIEKSTVRLSGVYLEGARKKTLLRKKSSTCSYKFSALSPG